MNASRRKIAVSISLLSLLALAGFALSVWAVPPISVPSSAIRIGDTYIDCIGSSAGGCWVFSASDGAVLETGNPIDRIDSRLRHLATMRGGMLVDCGRTTIARPDARVSECVHDAFGKHRPFTALYTADDSDVIACSYGLAGDAEGSVSWVTHRATGFPSIAPSRRTQLLDDNTVRLTQCVAPIELSTDANGLVGCIIPVNALESAKAAGQQVIETTICDINNDPAAYNNRLVRIRGSVSGNFEYSLISDPSCGGSLFAYPDEAGSPPGLAVHIAGESEPGAEDEVGKRILPIPVSLVEDRRLRTFERAMRARVKADKTCESSDEETCPRHQVTATFIGRVDGVSREIHELHKKRGEAYRSDFLGFGHMGLFDAQFVLKSVEDNAVLENQRE